MQGRESHPVRMEEQAAFERVDTAVQVTALLLRAGAYALVGGLADQYDCGHAILTGVLTGDLAASVAGLVWQRRGHAAQTVAELVLLGIVYLAVRGDLAWPAEPALRAILGLAAFGVFVTRTGGAMLTDLGPSKSGFA